MSSALIAIVVVLVMIGLVVAGILAWVCALMGVYPRASVGAFLAAIVLLVASVGGLMFLAKFSFAAN